jgi:hypothetical protein
MTDVFWQTLPLTIAAVGVAIPAVIAAVIGILNSRKLEEVHKATNGLGAALAASQKEVGHAEGHAEGRAEGVVEGKQAQRTRRNEVK